jgi:hypothetical protein
MEAFNKLIARLVEGSFLDGFQVGSFSQGEMMILHSYL